jgi:hypothetical protein
MQKLVFECFISNSIALSCFLSDFENMIEQLYQKLYDSFNNHEAYCGLDIMRWVEKPYGKATFVEMMVQKW